MVSARPRTPVRWAAIGCALVIPALVVSFSRPAPAAAHAAASRPAAAILREPALAALAVGAELRDLVAATPETTPTPAPTAVPQPPTAPPAPAPARPAPPATQPAPAVPHVNALTGPYGLGTGVGIYSDCGGSTPLPHAIAAIDTCVKGVTFFVGHNPGVFTPLVSVNVGDVITYWDGAGVAHPLRVISVRNWVHTTTPSIVPGATAQFQTCLNADGSLDRVLDAQPA